MLFMSLKLSNIKTLLSFQGEQTELLKKAATFEHVRLPIMLITPWTEKCHKKHLLIFTLFQSGFPCHPSPVIRGFYC